MTDTSAHGLVEHWGWAGKKGLVNASTARALATTCRGVLEVHENWEALDVSAIDVEDLLIRFKNLKSRNFTPNSLKTYESRFRRAVVSYRQYLDEPSTWKFGIRAATSRRSSPSDSPRTAQRKRVDEPSESAESTRSETISERSTPVDAPQEYLYPLRPDMLARLTIPRDTTVAEINRLVAWARTLATDYEPSEPSS